MSVATRSFKEVLWGLAFRAGFVPTGASPLLPAVSAQLTQFLNSAVKYAWQFYPWPDALTLAEEPVISHPTVAGARYVPRVTVSRSMDAVREVYAADPRASRCAVAVEYLVRPDGFYFFAESLSQVWVDYKGGHPRYTDEAYDNVKAYAVKALVMATDGHVYRCIQAGTGHEPSTSSTYWLQVPVLECLSEPITAGALGAYHATKGQHGTGRVKEEYMQELLEHEIVQAQREGGVLTYLN